MMTALMLLLALSPCLTPSCADDIAGNEVITWDPSDGATYYVLESNGVECETVPQRFGAKGRPKRPWLAVAPGQCALPSELSRIRVRACNPDGCSHASREVVVIEPHEWLCWDASGSVPCWHGDE